MKNNYNKENSDNEISRFIKIIAILIIVLLAIYGVTELFKKKDNGLGKKKSNVSINYDILTVGTLFTSAYDNYYVLIYNTKDNLAPKYSMLLSRYKNKSSESDYKKIYTIDLNNSLNKEYYNVNNDNKSNSNAKTIDDLDLGDLTLLEINDKKIVRYLENYDEISKFLVK